MQVSTTVVVTVSDESFDGQGLAADSGLAGTLVGDEVSRLLADPAVRLRMARLHAATGATAYLSQESYRPGKELDRLVRERDGTCRFPGCGSRRRGATSTMPWSSREGRPTSAISIASADDITASSTMRGGESTSPGTARSRGRVRRAVTT